MGIAYNFFIEVANVVRFALRFFQEVFLPPIEWGEIRTQGYEIGYKCLSLVSMTSFAMGLVIIIQSRPTLVEFGAGSYLPIMAAVSVFREVAPLVTALVCAGNIGSSISAELGSMKVTEQIDAMEVSGANPFKFLVVSRVVATSILVPVLVMYADAIALLGAFLGANIKGEISMQLFFGQVFDTVAFHDIIPATIKSFLFGFVIGIISCYKGYTSEQGTEGVGRAVNAAVIMSLLMVILLDLIAVQLISLLNIV